MISKRLRDEDASLRRDHEERGSSSHDLTHEHDLGNNESLRVDGKQAYLNLTEAVDALAERLAGVRPLHHQLHAAIRYSSNKDNDRKQKRTKEVEREALALSK